MTDKDIERILAEGYEIAAVILARGGWLNAARVEITCRFEAIESDPAALWRIDLYEMREDHTDEMRAYHSVFVKAESVVGISCRRYKQHA